MYRRATHGLTISNLLWISNDLQTKRHTGVCKSMSAIHNKVVWSMSIAPCKVCCIIKSMSSIIELITLDIQITKDIERLVKHEIILV